MQHQRQPTGVQVPTRLYRCEGRGGIHEVPLYLLDWHSPPMSHHCKSLILHPNPTPPGPSCLERIRECQETFLCIGVV